MLVLVFGWCPRNDVVDLERCQRLGLGQESLLGPGMSLLPFEVTRSTRIAGNDPSASVIDSSGSSLPAPPLTKTPRWTAAG
jgi:hypothetical protein